MSNEHSASREGRKSTQESFRTLLLVSLLKCHEGLASKPPFAKSSEYAFINSAGRIFIRSRTQMLTRSPVFGVDANAEGRPRGNVGHRSRALHVLQQHC